MENYTLTLFGRKRPVSKNTFMMFVGPLLVLLLILVWCTFGGIWRFGENTMNSGWLTMIPACIIFGSITMNDVRYAMLPKNIFTVWLSRIFMGTALFYYVYTVVNY